MHVILRIALHALLAIATVRGAALAHRRAKRSLYNFDAVIKCFQPWVSVLATYGDYGCYCGYKGSGQPLDETDACCYAHDRCYDEKELLASTLSERTAGSYFTDYRFTCSDERRALCNASLNSAFQQAFCECDRDAAACFLRNRRTYTPLLYNIDTSRYCSAAPDLADLHIGQHVLHRLYTCRMAPDQDRCCVDRGYNSVYQACCGDTLQPIGADRRSRLRRSTACCENRFYDRRRHACCYGVLRRRAAHLKCCGTEGGIIDWRRERCVDGVAYPLTDGD